MFFWGYGYCKLKKLTLFKKGAKLAISFVLNYEEGGENSIIHGDSASEVFLNEVFNHDNCLK